MIHTILKKFPIIILNFLSLIIPGQFDLLFAQNKNNPDLIPSFVNKFQYEIGEIRFLGNNSFTSSELQNILASRQTNRGYDHKILLYNDVQFFEQSKAENDVITLHDFYNQNGFHKANVSYTFEGDLSRQLNVLSFFINEDTASTISGITYLGLDSLPNDINYTVKSLMKVRIGERFNEERIFSEVRAIHFKLLDNGYYYAKYEMPLVLQDTTFNRDSVIISFQTGKRQKIDGIDYIDSTKGQNLVVKDMKDKQLEIGIGDWYSISKVNRSNNNLLSLGTFDIVSIDTSSIFKPQTDSTLSLLVFTQYRKQQEWGVSWYINRTAIDNFTNSGLEALYSHKNIGGIAQNFNIFFRPEIRDFSRWVQELFNLSKWDFQLQTGISLAQPLWFIIDKARFGVAGQLIYSYSKIFSELQLSTVSAPIKLPIKFPEFTFIQYGTFDVLFERQVPMNFDEAYQIELNKADSAAEKEKIKSSFKIYEALNKYRHETGMLVPSAFIFGGSLIGDTRNDIFNPSSGYYFNFSLDLTIPKIWLVPELGIAQFYRAQMSYYLFTRLSPTTIFAFKVRGGLTVWGDQEDTYVPIERQFFAGGANSVRGWASRRLRYPQPKASDYAEGTLDFFQDFVGSGTILEGSFELRFRFPRPANFDELLSEIISNIVLTSFVDWGNTFHWYSNYNYPYKFTDYFTKLAVAGGVGIGYLLPVGPIRMDLALPIYDPSAGRDKTIFTRENVMKDLKLHIGLGYSF